MSRSGKQSTLGRSLESLMNRLDRKSGGAYRQVRIAEAWAETAGPSVLAHTCQAHLREGELVVYVDSPLWATELSALSEQYRVRINEELGQPLVKKVRFSVSKRVGDRQEFARLEKETEEFYLQDKVASVPLTPEELDEVTRSTSSIPDEDLRRTVLRATIADLEWKKGLSAAKTPQKPREGR